MARNVRDAKTDSRSARRKLKARREPYWTKIAKGCFLGYRRGAADGGTWIARYRDDAGKQRYLALGPADDAMDADGVSAISFEQAQVKARDWCQSVAAADAAGETRGPYTMADCMADYLAWIKQHRKSHRHLDIYINAYILPTLGTVDTATLTAATIRAWHQGIADEPPRLRTGRTGTQQRYRQEDPDPAEALRKRRLRANRHLVTLRAALNRAWQEGHIAKNDAWIRVKPFPSVERQRSRFLSTDEARRLLNACSPDLRPLVQAALLTGARYGELCQLDVRDFQAESKTLFIRDSKSGKPRHIFLNDEGAVFCKRLTLGRPVDAPLITRSDGNRWERDHQHRPFKDAVKAAGIDPQFTFHELRHTWASLTVMAGAPLMVVATNLGHRDTRMVERHYGHLTQSYIAETIRETAPSFGLDGPTNVVGFAGR